jgi:hypothetical protein
VVGRHKPAEDETKFSLGRVSAGVAWLNELGSKLLIERQIFGQDIADYLDIAAHTPIAVGTAGLATQHAKFVVPLAGDNVIVAIKDRVGLDRSGNLVFNFEKEKPERCSQKLNWACSADIALDYSDKAVFILGDPNDGDNINEVKVGANLPALGIGLAVANLTGAQTDAGNKKDQTGCGCSRDRDRHRSGG